ncbi:MAG: hypothetical protein ACRC1T_17760 [Clostridium chrysemydis]|uniref:hypothetical protein n=1 Tax=Clostridium chrysemydis TaxID=2665504 RepID=UPI003F31DABC
MYRKNIKKIVLITILVIAVSIGFTTLYFGSTKTEAEGNVSNESSQSKTDDVNDVVKTIVEMNYQPLTSMVKENTEKGYVVIDADKDTITCNLHRILETAKNLKIKITFLNNDGVFNEGTSFFELVEKGGHTVLPHYIEIEDILNQNNVKIIRNNDDIESVDKEDVAFIVNSDNIKTDFVKQLSDEVKNLEGKGYHFKAFV